ncbi:hypothetical protein CFAM422_004841 [Trichoderma lentiforme]|uniref:Uncharacterized protein n=1 Tax=Trichoderma lentiforme TaxID=1567552 RepID=A0A9P4XIF7_9HYPO|nr:hypothetical protein CFAM422_004841 [Trichoderma lentiforme]
MFNASSEVAMVSERVQLTTADPPQQIRQILHGRSSMAAGRSRRGMGKWKGMHLLKSKLSTLKDHTNNSVSLAPSSKVWQGENLQPVLAAMMSFRHFADQPWSLPFPSPYRHQSDFTGTDTGMAQSAGQASGSQHGQHLHIATPHTTTTQCIVGPPLLIPAQ